MPIVARLTAGAWPTDEEKTWRQIFRIDEHKCDVRSQTDATTRDGQTNEDSSGAGG